MKLLLSIVLIFTIIVTPSLVFAADDSVEKTDCKLAIGYDSMDELKADLLLNAKRQAVNQLFGELIVAATAVKDFVVTSDQIRASSLGLVREDTIRYFNSDNFGELCITITVYTTNEDRQQFKPVKLNKRNCVSDSDLSAKALRKFAEEEAIVKAVVEYNRKLEGKDRDKLLGLLQRVIYSESAMLPDTDTYCAHVEGEITPIEAIALLHSEPAQESVEETTATYDDEFDGPTLNPNWHWLNEDTRRWSLETTPGNLQIIGTGGEFAGNCNNFKNLLLQPAPTGDFTLETKMSMDVSQPYQQGGLLVFENPDNWIVLGVVSHEKFLSSGNSFGQGVNFVSEQGGRFVPDWPWPMASNVLTNAGIFLKITKNANEYEGLYSIDGEKWIRLNSVSFPSMTNPHIGLYASASTSVPYQPPNCPQGAPDIPANFDFFHVKYASTDITEAVVDFKSGIYRVESIFRGKTYEMTYKLEIDNNEIVGTGEADCCPGPRTFKIWGFIAGNNIFVQTGDCSNDYCSHQVGTISDNIITGQYTDNTNVEGGTWTLYLQE